MAEQKLDAAGYELDASGARLDKEGKPISLAPDLAGLRVRAGDRSPSSSPSGGPSSGSRSRRRDRGRQAARRPVLRPNTIRPAQANFDIVHVGLGRRRRPDVAAPARSRRTRSADRATAFYSQRALRRAVRRSRARRPIRTSARPCSRRCRSSFYGERPNTPVLRLGAARLSDGPVRRLAEPAAETGTPLFGFGPIGYTKLTLAGAASPEPSLGRAASPGASAAPSPAPSAAPTPAPAADNDPAAPRRRCAGRRGDRRRRPRPDAPPRTTEPRPRSDSRGATRRRSRTTPAGVAAPPRLRSRRCGPRLPRPAPRRGGRHDPADRPRSTSSCSGRCPGRRNGILRATRTSRRQRSRRTRERWGLDKPLIPDQLVAYVVATRAGRPRVLVRLARPAGDRGHRRPALADAPPVRPGRAHRDRRRAGPRRVLRAGDAAARSTYVGNGVSLILYSMPYFLLGMILLLIFAIDARLVPDVRDGHGRARPTPRRSTTSPTSVRHLVLPVATVALGLIGQYSILMRSSIIETLSEDYITTARAKGYPERPDPAPPRAPERAAAGRDARSPSTSATSSPARSPSRSSSTGPVSAR